MRLRSDAIFRNFVPGMNGEVLAALQLPESGPLWLWGPRGCGKTHLLQAACAAAAGQAAYFPLGKAAGLPPQALSGFARAQLLCLDDADAVMGDEAWEQALFRTFNEAAEFGSRLIIAATMAPRHAAWRLEDWRSRAGACVIYQLRELDDDGRIEALRLRAAQRGLELSEEASDYLLKRMPRDLRSLLSLLDQLDEASLVAQRPLTIPFIRAALEKRVETKS